MRRQFGKTIVELAERDSKLVLLYGDVKQCMDEFERKFPDRIYNFGIREQATISAAAGMAMQGLRPVVYSLTPFLLRRAYEQVALDVDLQSSPVILIGYADYPGEGPTQNMSNDEIRTMFTADGFKTIRPYFPTDFAETRQAMLDAHQRALDGKPSLISLKQAKESS